MGKKVKIGFEEFKTQKSAECKVRNILSEIGMNTINNSHRYFFFS